MHTHRPITILILLFVLCLSSCNMDEILTAVPGSGDYYGGHGKAMQWMVEHQHLYPTEAFHTGFHEEFLIPGMARDRAGELQDMIIMRCNLMDYWREMETDAELSDWQRAR